MDRESHLSLSSLSLSLFVSLCSFLFYVFFQCFSSVNQINFQPPLCTQQNIYFHTFFMRKIASKNYCFSLTPSPPHCFAHRYQAVPNKNANDLLLFFHSIRFLFFLLCFYMQIFSGVKNFCKYYWA